MARTYTFKELKESRLLYDRKPPMFGLIMTFLTLAFVVAALVWAALSAKTYVVKATGLVADEKKTNIMNAVGGEVESISVVEGQAVKVGDTILTIDSYQVRLQIAQLQAMVDMYGDRIVQTQALISFVQNYKVDDESTQENPFDGNDPETMRYYTDADTFLTYVRQQKSQSESEGSELSQSSIDDIKNAFLSQQSVFTYLDQYLAERAQQVSQLKMYEDSLSAYTVYAVGDGIVHLSAGLTQGTVLSAGTLLGSIVSGEQANLYIDTVVSATERSKLTVGSAVEIAVSGAAQTEYGVINGKVVSIDNDSTQTEDGQVYYRVRVLPDKTELTDKKGNTVRLTTGMIGECRIKYDETTWLKWAIE
ncbi:MAG: HlyD family efflux transporter periplasmic adaptor subunit, partial [Clostridia bacterium]|nr:HlyD family efflux transporter periplasmic adaptor subunit [Clostridia bacterium]